MSKLKAKNTLYNDPMYDVVVDSRMLEQYLKEKDQQLEELQNQTAIEELRLALDNFRNRPTYFDVARQELCLSEQDKQFIDFINNRIKELGGGENE